MNILATTKNKLGSERGQAVMGAVLLTVIMGFTILDTLVTPLTREIDGVRELGRSRLSYYTAESATEDATYRLRNNLNYSPSYSLSLNNSSAAVTITDSGDNKIITAVGDYLDRYRTLQTTLNLSTSEAQFFYGIQAGNGGFVLRGGSQITGNVYSNGSIVSTNGERITGSAVAANLPALTADQSNTTPATIASCTTSVCVTFRNTSGTQDVAQSFQVSTLAPVNKVRFFVKKVGSPASATVRIVADNAGRPGTYNLLSTNGTLNSTLVTTSFGWVDVVFPTNPSLDPGETYWVVIDSGSQSSSNYFIIGANNTYSGGSANIGQYNGTWNNTTPAGLDLYFDLYLGGGNSTIGGGGYVGATRIGTTASDITWAHTVSGAQVSGPLYCQTGTNNNKACDTSRADPSSTAMPISDSQIESWKDQATTTPGGWTYNGNLTIGYAGTTTATLKHINGNLTVNGGGIATFGELEVTGNITISGGGRLKAGPLLVGGNLTVGSTGLTLKGTTYVKGNFILNSGAAVGLDASYGADSGIFVTDGYMDLSGGGTFSGSGTTGSYPVLVTASNCPAGGTCAGHNAVDVSGGAGAVVIVAQNGTIYMSGGTSAKAMVANQIVVEGGGSVSYESGLASLSFSSGPGATFEITKWQEQ